MLSPVQTVAVIAVFFFVYAVVIPLLDASERFSKFISLRYFTALIPLFMLVAVILDFSHVSENCRLAVIIGGLVVALVFIVARSIEKAAFGAKRITLKGEYGKVRGEVQVEDMKTRGAGGDAP